MQHGAHGAHPSLRSGQAPEEHLCWLFSVLSVFSVVNAIFFVPVATPAAAAPKKKAAPARVRSPWDVEAREYLGTPATEKAVARALKYLAGTQNPDGTWISSSYTSEAGIAGLCAMAFMAAGHQPGRGPY